MARRERRAVAGSRCTSSGPPICCASFSKPVCPPHAAPAIGPGCDLTAQSSQGQPPNITSPLRGVVYTLTDGSGKVDNDGDRRDSIALSAITDADAGEVFWFVGGSLIGRSKTGQPYLWKLPTSPGKYIIRAVDDHGRSDTRELQVARSR